MNDYVFKSEFYENLPSDDTESQNQNQNTEKLTRGESVLRFVFIQSVVCVIIVLSAILIRTIAPDTYAVFKTGYISAVEESDVKFEDIKAFFSKIGAFLFSEPKPKNAIPSSSGIPQNETSSQTKDNGSMGGSDVLTVPDTVSLNAYITTVPISALTKGTVTCEFGWRIHPIFKTKGFHTGIDIASKLGTPITTPFSGCVYEVGKNEAYGNYVIMKHSDSLYTFYGHCDSVKAENGMVLRQGEVIAYMGSTGYSTGPHLHFEMRIDGKCVDPAYVLKGIKGIEF